MLVIRKNTLKSNFPIAAVVLLEIAGMIRKSMVSVILICMVNALFYLVYFGKCSFKKNKEIYSYFLFMAVCFTFSHFYNHNVNFKGLIYIVILFPITILLLNTSLKPFSIKLIYWIYTIYLIICVMCRMDFNNVFETSSRNYVSVVYIFLICLLAFTDQNGINKIPYKYFVIPIFFSILAVGRGGILCIGVLFTGKLIIDILSEKNTYKKMLYIGGLIIASLLSVFLIAYGSQMASVIFSRFVNEGFHDDARATIWGRYYSLVMSDKWNILLGAEIDNDRYLARLTGNLHNSFVSMHSRFGGIFLLTNLVLLAKAILFYIHTKRYDFLMALSVFLLRGMTDILFSVYWGDVIWWYFLFYPLYKKKSLKPIIYQRKETDVEEFIHRDT